MTEDTFTLHIYEARPRDAAELQHLLFETWKTTYPNEEYGITVQDIEDYFTERLTEDGIKESAGRIGVYTPKRMVLLGRDYGTGQLVAMCRGTKAVLRDDGNWLRALYVLPSYQRCGVGRAMVEHMTAQHFHKAAATRVRVASYNTNAIAFYCRLGFRQTSEPIPRKERFILGTKVIPELTMERGVVEES